MKFYYGYDDDHYVNITSIVFDKCLNDDGIFIPSGDGARCDIVGYDPYPNILKHIGVFWEGKKYVYNATKEVRISWASLSYQLDIAKSPKHWWEKEGKYIADPVQRLEALQKRINLHYVGHGGFEYEYPEQLMCMRFIFESDKVLEIGGNIGRTAHIIHTIINDSRNHVVMECDPETARKLRYNLDLNTYTELRIETAALSKVPLYNCGGNPRPLLEEEITAAIPLMPTISYEEICKKYEVNFDVLVADCEGSLFYIFKEDPDMLDGIHTVIMENDYTDMDHKQMVDAILTLKGFECIYQEKGVPWASWSCCYEFFYEVWRRRGAQGAPWR
jgi:FkbM family methyltransferase